nr:hypothetical protein [Tanacetum cinerariifolium]
PWGCVFELGKVVESWEKWWVRWRKDGKWSSGVKTVGGKNGQKCYSTSFKRGRDDGISGHLTLLVPVVM